MHVRLLGTAAGGGFPQWNCACRNCHGVRSGTLRAKPRTQSCIAISADGRRWFLVNASPDVRAQVESFPPLWPADGVRGSGIEGVLLTNADLDHTLGLLVLREGRRLPVHAPPPVRRSLTEDFPVAGVLQHYCGIDWHEPPRELTELRDASGAPSGLCYSALPLPGHPARYARHRAPSPGDVVGYRFVDTATGTSVVCAPEVGAIDERTLRDLGGCDLLLLDGTFWIDDEMSRAGVGTATASDMGHLPVGGPGGSLARLTALGARRVVYVHINNTNPILIEDSPERRTVETAGAVVGEDGMEFFLPSPVRGRERLQSGVT